MKNLFFCLMVLLVFSSVKAQDNNDIKLSALPYYNYGKGLGITSADSIFQLNIRFRMQNRVTYLRNDDEDPAYEALIRRLRLRFDGYVGDPKIIYVIQLSFSPGDVGAIENGENINIIRDAVVFYRPNKHWNIGFGQTKLPGNRQRINSSGALQLTDRSINNARFNIDRDFGLQIYYLNELETKFSYNVKTAISTGEGRNWTREPDNGLAFTGKLELFPLGSFQSNGTFFEGDLKREDRPKIMISGVYHYNEKARRNQGTLGNELFERRDLKSLFVDTVVKYDGWAFQAAYMKRMADDPITINPNDSNNLEYAYVGDGFDTQLSYLFENNYEVIGRFSHQTPNAKIASLTPQANQYTLGVTKYIWEHALKLQAEVTRTDLNYFDTTHAENWYLRFQVEIGI
ncbi:porin [Subsaximicrobium wynnwilliamsii]|uniref:Porin n=1 Tax=Subsaximicrobium wynnwilliamsii TaxID=291179 RepID=A0A5C6ZK64_9FLAO|nr:porin [Subsaximicrobium wynnwilliamsii]TXD84923.1 porin [Subsaximicrobium wynnwilliamsii]TXD90594.1 porin [Subsaximicrobium wynnwilliamsii]TXE05068.1 porin [Subsaximicrobium wynnwilliamsii]